MDFKNIKKEFPILANDEGLLYLDNASTTQKPARVLQAMNDFYLASNANIHRGVYGLAEKADLAYEKAREVAAKFIGAEVEEVIFTKNATEGVGLAAFGIGEAMVGTGDNAVVTELEHHANFLPWQEMAKRRGAELRVIRVKNEMGELNEEELMTMIDGKTKVVAVTAMSNVLGVRPDLEKIVSLARKFGALVAVDCAQSAAHAWTDVKKLNCDMAFFTGHKLFGPMGTGFCYLRKELAEKIPPMLTGGGMIEELPDNWLAAPMKFEAGTPNVAGLVGMAEGLKMICETGLEKIAVHEKKLVKSGREILSKIPEVKLFGPMLEREWTSIIAFEVAGVHPHDLASILAEDGIAIRAGHHCAKPLLKRLGKSALARVSFSVYNDESELGKLEGSIKRAIKLFS